MSDNFHHGRPVIDALRAQLIATLMAPTIARFHGFPMTAEDIDAVYVRARSHAAVIIDRCTSYERTVE